MDDSEGRYSRVVDPQKVLMRHLSIEVFYDVKTRSSFCWKYFGNLVMDRDGRKAATVVDPDKVFCLACLTAIKMESEDVTFGSVNVKSYKKSVSTGNLTRHLREMHVIIEDGSEDSEPEEPAAKKRRTKKSTSMVDAAVMTDPDVRVLDKMQLTKDMIFWSCKSLMPFDYISHDMTDFFKKRDLIASDDDMPSREMISLTVDNIYETILKIFQLEVQLHDLKHLALTFDTWSDRRRGINYVTTTAHYLTNAFDLKSINIGTKIVDCTPEENIMSVIDDTRKQLCLSDNTLNPVHVVTRAEENVKQELVNRNLNNHSCIGHGFHNLITVDGIMAVPEIKSLVLRCKNILQVMGISLQKLDGLNSLSECQKEFLSGLSHILASLDADENDPIPANDFKPEDSETQKNNHNKTKSLPGGLLRIECVSSTDANTSVPTRWHNILAVLECLAKVSNRDVFRKIMKGLQYVDKITKYEWTLIGELVSFLGKFRDVVEVVSSQKTCTMNVALLFRSEIKDILDSADTESPLIQKMKCNMLANIDKRLSVTRTIVTAALLDNRCIGLKEIDLYLNAKYTTRITFLAESVREILSNTSMPNSECEDEGASPETSLLNKLVVKHRASTGQEVHIKDPIERECWRYFATAESSVPRDGNLLGYWNSKQREFYWLSALARALLCVPATSAPAHRMFSTAGLDFSTKRSRLDLCSLSKILFIHDNCDAFVLSPSTKKLHNINITVKQEDIKIKREIAW